MSALNEIQADTRRRRRKAAPPRNPATGAQEFFGAGDPAGPGGPGVGGATGHGGPGSGTSSGPGAGAGQGGPAGGPGGSGPPGGVGTGQGMGSNGAPGTGPSATSAGNTAPSLSGASSPFGGTGPMGAVGQNQTSAAMGAAGEHGVVASDPLGLGFGTVTTTDVVDMAIGAVPGIPNPSATRAAARAAGNAVTGTVTSATGTEAAAPEGHVGPADPSATPGGSPSPGGTDAGGGDRRMVETSGTDQSAGERPEPEDPAQDHEPDSGDILATDPPSYEKYTDSGGFTMTGSALSDLVASPSRNPATGLQEFAGPSLDFMKRNPAAVGAARYEERERAREQHEWQQRQRERARELDKAQRQAVQEQLQQDQQPSATPDPMGRMAGAGDDQTNPDPPGERGSPLSGVETTMVSKLASTPGGGKAAWETYQQARQRETENEREALAYAAKGQPELARAYADQSGVQLPDGILNDARMSRGLMLSEQMGLDDRPQAAMQFAQAYKDAGGDLGKAVESVDASLLATRRDAPTIETFEQGDQKVTAQWTGRGWQPIASAPREGDDTQRQRQIRNLTRRPQVRNLANKLGRTPQQMAVDLVDDNVRTEMVPETGSMRVVDEVSGEAYEMPVQQWQALGGAGGAGATGGAGGTGAPTGAATAGSAGQGQDTGRREALAAGDGPTTDAAKRYDPENMIGGGAALREFSTDTIGQVFDSLQFGDTAQARTKYRLMREMASSVMRESSRVSNQERQQILDTMPGLGVFQNPETGVGQLRTFREQMQQIKRSEQAFADNPNNSPQLREKAANHVRRLDMVLDQLNQVEGVGAGTNRRDDAGGGSADLPEGVPEGSTREGYTGDGNPVYRTPDGERLVHEQQQQSGNQSEQRNPSYDARAPGRVTDPGGERQPPPQRAQQRTGQARPVPEKPDGSIDKDALRAGEVYRMKGYGRVRWMGDHFQQLDGQGGGNAADQGARSLPTDGQGNIARDRLERGTTYDTPRGPATWTGSRFRLEG